MRNIIMILCALFLVLGCRSNIEEQENVDINQLTPYNASQSNAHNSRNSLDWEGTYSGVLPCADCIGVESYLTLKGDQSYELTQRYIGSTTVGDEEHTTLGTFNWNEEGSVIYLRGIENDSLRLRVGELFLSPLHSNGLQIQPEPGNNFRLLKH